MNNEREIGVGEPVYFPPGTWKLRYVLDKEPVKVEPPPEAPSNEE